MRRNRLFTALRHAHIDPADGGAGGSSNAPGSEPFDVESALFDHLASEEDKAGRSRARARTADNGEGVDDDPAASHEAGDTDGDDADPDDPDGDDPGDNSPDDDPDAEPDPELLNARVRIKAGDKHQVVTVAELRNGYLRQQDYTRKTMEVAQHRQKMVDATQFVMQQRQALDGILSAQQEQLASMAPERLSEAQLDQLSQQNPTEYMRLVRAYDRYDRMVATLQQQRIENAQVAQAQAAVLSQENAAREYAKLIERRPEWADPVKGKAARDEMTEYMQTTYGVSPQEFAGAATSHQVLDIVAKAMAYDRAVAAHEARVRGNRSGDGQEQRRAPRPATPGSAAPPPRIQNRQRQQQRALDAQRRAAKSGKVDDAASAIEALL
jgi:hypothetical protein